MEERRSIVEDLRDSRVDRSAARDRCEQPGPRAEHATPRLCDIMSKHDNLNRLVAHQSVRVGFRRSSHWCPGRGRAESAARRSSDAWIPHERPTINVSTPGRKFAISTPSLAASTARNSPNAPKLPGLSGGRLYRSSDSNTRRDGNGRPRGHGRPCREAAECRPWVIADGRAEARRLTAPLDGFPDRAPCHGLRESAALRFGALWNNGSYERGSKPAAWT